MENITNSYDDCYNYFIINLNSESRNILYEYFMSLGIDSYSIDQLLDLPEDKYVAKMYYNGDYADFFQFKNFCDMIIKNVNLIIDKGIRNENNRKRFS